MKVSREEILHIANLARLDLEENEIDKYLENLDDILNFAAYASCNLAAQKGTFPKYDFHKLSQSDFFFNNLDDKYKITINSLTYLIVGTGNAPNLLYPVTSSSQLMVNSKTNAFAYLRQIYLYNAHRL